MRNGDGISTLSPGKQGSLAGNHWCPRSCPGHPCPMDTESVWVLCFLQGIFIPARFQQTPRAQSLMCHCRNLALGREGTSVTWARGEGKGQFCVLAVCSSHSEWAMWMLRALKLCKIFLHYFFHLGAISCHCSLAARGDLSSPGQPFLPQHSEFSSVPRSSLSAHSLSASGCCCRVPVAKARSQNTLKPKPHSPCCAAKRRKAGSEQIFAWLPCFLAQRV